METGLVRIDAHRMDLLIERTLRRIEDKFRGTECGLIIDDMLYNLRLCWDIFWLNFGTIETFMGKDLIAEKIDEMFVHLVRKEARTFARLMADYAKSDAFVRAVNVDRAKMKVIQNLRERLVPHKLYAVITGHYSFDDPEISGNVGIDFDAGGTSSESEKTPDKPEQATQPPTQPPKPVDAPKHQICEIPNVAKCEPQTGSSESLCPILTYRSQVANPGGVKQVEPRESQVTFSRKPGGLRGRQTRFRMKEKGVVGCENYDYIFDSRPVEREVDPGEACFVDPILLKQFKDELIDILSNDQVYSHQQGLVYDSISQYLAEDYLTLDNDILFAGASTEVGAEGENVQEDAGQAKRLETRDVRELGVSGREGFRLPECGEELRGVFQRRLGKIVSALRIPEDKVGEMVPDGELGLFLCDMEAVVGLVQQREAQLSRMAAFEWEATDPGRLFVPGTWALRKGEEKERATLAERMDSLEARVMEGIKKIKAKYGVDVSYRDCLYSEKIKHDKKEMLFWLQEERKRQYLTNDT